MKDYEEPPEILKQYHKSHGTLGPAEQIKRENQWNIDPNEHRFDLADLKKEKGVDAILKGDFHQSNYPKTKIVKKAVEDFRSVITEELGKGKNRGQLGLNEREPPENLVFGFKA